MDANYVHQRDVANIIANLHQQIEQVHREQEMYPVSQEELNKKLQDLIASTDRDLRLKTQSIVRTRLTQSKTIPVNFAPLVQLDGHKFQTPYEPLQDADSLTKSPYFRSMSRPSTAKSNQPNLPNNSPHSFAKTNIAQPFTNQQPKSSRRARTALATTSTSSISPLTSRANLESERNLQSSVMSKSSKLTKSGSKSSHTDSTKVLPHSTKLTKTDTKKKLPQTAKGKLTRNDSNVNGRITPSTVRRPLPERPKTAISTKRKRMIPNYVPQLPQVDKHDPKADPPPVNEMIVKKYGLQQLNEIKVIKDEKLQDHLKGLVTVSPFKKDIAADYRNFNQNYYLDPVKPQEEVPEKPKIDMLQIPSDDDDAALSTATGHYIFTLINGVPNPLSQEFQHFKSHNSPNWESIEIILNMLTPICEQYGLSEIKVDGNIIAEFIKYEPDEIQTARLFRCFLILPRRKRISTKVGFGFVGPNAQDKAATLIQSIWRGFNARRVVRMIKRHNIAAKIIQSRWRVHQLSVLFVQALEKDRKKKMLRFDALQTDTTGYRPSEPHLVIYLIGSFDGVEIGRLTFLNNKASTIVLYLRKAPPPDVAEIIRSLSIDNSRLHIIVTSLKLPTNLSIEDLFVSDLNAMKKMRLFAGQMPIYIVPTRIHYATVDSSIKLSALALVPSPVRIQMYESREAVRRILKNAGTELFESSSEIFDYDSLCKELSGLAVTSLKIQSWVLYTNDGSIGWLNTSDFSLLEKLRAHKDAVSEDDLMDASFREILQQNIAKDLPHTLYTTGDIEPESFLRNFVSIGGTIEAGPQHTKSAPAAAFYVPPIGHPEIVGTWETLYISAHEPFASIHPAFTVNRDKLKKKTYKIAAECSSKRLIGTSVVQYYYSARNLYDSEENEEMVQMKLTPTDLIIGKLYEALPQFYAQTILHVNFDEESMSNGPSTYIYVQRSVIFPEAIPLAELKARCHQFLVPVDVRVFFTPSLNDQSVYSMLIVEEAPERLIYLVYRTFVTLSDNVFILENDLNAPLFSYLNAIEFLKQQYDSTNDLSSTVLSKKMKHTVTQVREQRVFQFNKLIEETKEEPNEEEET
ncbi:hypothetical protein TRFO_05589 [Tritrichomonas foetus]|uniref:IQCH-like ATP-grasp domain-containing protein n=1 Tax=Tritrichomonas foetus TaxID=1144522 RepID=A0A1J4K9S3_9EUKA|nr:hypothetical protein TRFO_05589 [Tritrichomonas foetus]|eukprot:OHT06390.1 hypothetical protein TRFO_05589 [Tritrichomonas foetus]